VRPDRKRALVDKVRSDWKVSIRRACATLRIDRALYVYKSKRGGQADLKQRIKEIAETRVRYGYRRIHVLLQREGWAVNPKRIYPLYKELGLQLRHKAPKRRVKAKLRGDRAAAQRDMGDGLCPRPARHLLQDPCADGRRHLLPVLASDRSALRSTAIELPPVSWTPSLGV
jgi:transposase InsO family protein